MKCLGRRMMRSQLHMSILLAATLGLAGSTFARPLNMSPAATDGTQVIDVRAKKYEFNPSPIRVKQGTRVQLKITATDHVHGFRITEFPDGVDTKGKAGLVFSSPQDCRRIEKGQTETIEFVAQTPGTYPFKCCVHCGWEHRTMKGELIVEP
jgi:heme/copper-type cytochrome/quinol oxidase subunit 2